LATNIRALLRKIEGSAKMPIVLVRRFARSMPCLLAAMALTGLIAQPLAAQTQSPANKSPVDTALEGASKLGEGVVAAYKKADNTLFVLPKETFERLFLWYSETVTVPTGVVDHLSLGGTVVQFQRRGKQVFIRDLTASFGKRAAGRQAPEPGQTTGARVDPIALAVRRANEPPIVAVLPVLAAADDGRVLVDVTKLFSNDIETMSARSQVVQAGLIPIQVNSAASYITSVRVFPKNLGVRTHLTFLAKSKDPIAPPRSVSLRVGHSLVMLPRKPMPSRRFDPRVGFFRTGAGVTAEDSKYTIYEASGRLARSHGLIMRYRLEKKNPDAEVSDPVKPIVFYIGREVPDRWRPYIKAAVESWQPAFRVAGFSNAIAARDAPAFKDAHNWTPEDARHSTIRWIAQPKANATGPHTVDPRSGEILSSHVEVWPQVITLFSHYYFGIHNSLDERAKTLPLSEEMQGLLLQYAVAHEVGHAIGLRHNHLASTAYSVAQMRDPKFANKWGANTSIMAYGRWNQAAQPGDGVKKFIPGQGPYDYFAIKWGYGVFGNNPVDENKALAAFVAKAQSDRRLLWAAGELPGEFEIWSTDPRVLKESTGAERIEATRLGVANILRSLRNLSSATGDDDAELVSAYNGIQTFHMAYLKSVTKLIAGVEAHPWAKSRQRRQLVPPGQQRAAIRYLLGEGARSLDAYKAPELLDRVAIFGGGEPIDRLQASLVGALFQDQLYPTAPAYVVKKLPLLQAQKSADPNAYGPLDFANDSYDALWSDLMAAPHWRRVLQRAYLDKIAGLFKIQKTADRSAQAKANAALVNGGTTSAFAAVATSTAADTVFVGWAHDMLPKLARQLRRAARKARTPDDRFHFWAMAVRAQQIAQEGK
jgi:Met-zincin/Domain of unknown function (DUF5117)